MLSLFIFIVVLGDSSNVTIGYDTKAQCEVHRANVKSWAIANGVLAVSECYAVEVRPAPQA